MGIRIKIVSEDHDEKSMILGMRVEIDKSYLESYRSFHAEIGRSLMFVMTEALAAWHGRKK